MTRDTQCSIVADWYAHEAGKDFPRIPTDWTPEHWLLLVTEHADMRFWVAHQPAAPEPAVRVLAADVAWRVRWRVAMRRNLPADLFATMASDADASVRKAVAANAKAPLAILELLTNDVDAMVSAVARRNVEKRAR